MKNSFSNSLKDVAASELQVFAANDDKTPLSLGIVWNPIMHGGDKRASALIAKLIRNSMFLEI
jgi:hypothetical protein